MTKGALLLLPNLLSDQKHHEPYLPSSVDKAVKTLDGLIAESEGGARRFLSRFQHEKKPHEIPVALLNKHTKDEDLSFLLEPVRKGERWGLISDAGLPCIADPGSKLVALARKGGLLVQAFSGPSSLTLALMLSGLPSERFTFHGYLPREKTLLKKAVTKLLARSKEDAATEVFIETPHRNQELLLVLLETMPLEAMLSVCFDLTESTQGVITEPISVWKKMTLPNLEKRPAIFLIAAPKKLA